MIRYFAVLAASLLAAGCSQNLNSSNTMSMRGDAFAPPAFYSFCSGNQRLCSTAGSVKSVKMTPQKEAELKAVNLAVNRKIKEREDSTSGPVKDVWRVPTTSGDCEDFAILKKQELLKRGWPASALLLTTATMGGTGHTVLTVRTDRGDLILDNRSSAVKNWTRTAYKYHARQSQSANGQWTRIGS